MNADEWIELGKEESGFNTTPADENERYYFLVVWLATKLANMEAYSATERAKNQ